jgi:hypothetical protein
MRGGVVMHVAVMVDMLGRRLWVNVDHPGHMAGVGQARRNGM